MSRPILRDILAGHGPKPSASGSALKPGGHGDNCQTASYELKPDGFEVAVKPELPGKWSPIKIGGGHADNISKGPNEDALKPPAHDSEAASEKKSFLGGALGKLLKQLFPKGLWGLLMSRGNKPGGGHSDNVLMNSQPARDRGIIQ